MVNTEIGLIIFFAAKDREALYSQQKQDQELTVAQIMNSLLVNSDRNFIPNFLEPPINTCNETLEDLIPHFSRISSAPFSNPDPT